ncbi:callose synthase 12-like protein [Carex littledalei]|uniref:1,3-beta-glucan synthase n=1 Tax=Carex littledalei TaxID=544730 RepID=A0A833V6G7_9POAL|nr:callose synthase 12-like protein [Carex littledalei]
MSHHSRPSTAPPPPAGPAPYNIIPINDILSDHPSLRFAEVRAATAALLTVGDLPVPSDVAWDRYSDLLDWLSAFFGFQRDNVRNQREHILLLLANYQMRLPQPDQIDSLESAVARKLRKKLLKNYCSWCAYLGVTPNLWPTDRDPRRDLLYSALYLLIWGEAANLRFMPECLCYIFHHMARDLNRLVDGYIDEYTGQPARPAFSGENAFLHNVVIPIYEVVKAEAESSNKGTKPHSKWRNYDDINEYFWSSDVFKRLGWPLDLSRGFFHKGKVGKTGFVEQRSFLNIYRSFDRLWVMLILYLQVAIIVAWHGQTLPWKNLQVRDTQVTCLTGFITWAGLRFFQSLLDAGTQYSLISRERPFLVIRMALKSIVSAGWTLVFSILYVQIWNQKDRDKRWSSAANQRVTTFLYASVVYLLPEALAIALFIIPWVRNFLEKSNWKILYALTWWFQSRSFVGRGLREGTIDNVKYSLFWIGLLAVKFTFSYFLQIRPMVAPTKAIYHLKNVDYTWHEFFGRSNRFAVVLLWLPVILIYLMDIQIWYAIFSSFTGALVGLFSHLGEIRDTRQLRLRFQFFASAMQFNLMPEEQLFQEHGTMRVKFHNFWQRLKLRYGLGRPYRKIEANQLEARRFALIWNKIITTFREEDILSDHEVLLLELPPDVWNVGVVRWPCILLCNELSLALSRAKELKGPDRRLWRKICKNEYRRCAVIEAYYSAKHLLLTIVKEQTEEYSILSQLFIDFEDSMKAEKFTVEYNMPELPKIHNSLKFLLKELTSTKKDLTKVVNQMQNLYDILIRDFPSEKKTRDQLKQAGLAPSRPAEGRLFFEHAVELPGEENAVFYRQVKRLETILTSRDSMSNVPNNIDARRRITFFSNSLFMNMPRAPQVEKMMAFSVLTPYYEEEVMYKKDQLHSENEDGVSTLFYLQKIYADEWTNFLERMKRQGIAKDEISGKGLPELRLWASYRGQTLSRTVRGMMYYYKALEMLTFLDSANEMDIRDGRELGSVSSRRQDGSSRGHGRNSIGQSPASSGTLSRVNSDVSALFKGHESGTALMKFTYVVACQLYGSQKAKKDARADDILYLMKNNEALRVAYVDEVKKGAGSETEYYSVLVKYDQKLEKEVEIYRIKLPGKLVLGEGKPENQNHAMIFTRGDAVQTIDMNQDSYFEEALKLRNLLEEYNRRYGTRKPTLLGVREHVFTGSVSSLAWFMSAQEMSFVTLGQRVLANPLKIRMHYGHPDVFDRLWFITRGGISKASKTINISEDIFAGFNCTLRGGNVTHHEYIQVGKGRDVGLNQVSMFEAKVSSGNGEQTLSRDVYRLGHRLDFFRMLSFFYTTVGFYFNTMIVVWCVYAFVWGRLYLALSGLESSIEADSSTNSALVAVLNQQFIIQLGIFTALPMIIENSLEFGFLNAIWDFIKMQLQLASMFYSFSMGTKAHYYGRTILHGGAKYRATGRGFVVQHKSFADNYRLYARSHFIKGIEIGLILIVYASYSAIAKNSFVYIALTISSWFLVVSWILSPFIFNPSGFDWLKTYNDFKEFMNWIWFQGGISVKAEQSWEVWWEEETDHLRNTGLWGKVIEIILDLRYFFFQFGIVYQLHIASNNTSILVYLLSWICIVAAVVLFVIVSHASNKYAAKKHIYYRMVQAITIILVIAAVVALLEFTNFKFVDLFTSMVAFFPTGWGIISILLVFKPILVHTSMWDTLRSFARFYDILLGLIVFAPLAVLTWLPGIPEMQTRILFNEAFSRGLQISRILTGKKTDNVKKTDDGKKTHNQ